MQLKKKRLQIPDVGVFHRCLAQSQGGGRRGDWQVLKCPAGYEGLWRYLVGGGGAVFTPGGRSLSWAGGSGVVAGRPKGGSWGEACPASPPPHNTHTTHTSGMASAIPPSTCPAPVSQQTAGVRFSLCSAPQGKKANTHDC